MKASELRPGQFFDSPYCRTRHLVVDRHEDDQQLEVFHKTSGQLLRYHFNNEVNDCLQSWDDVPQSEPAPLQLREGGVYRMRYGRQAGPIKPWRSRTYDEIRWTHDHCFWDDSGLNCGPSASASLDLIAEVPPPEPEHDPKPQQGDHYDYLNWSPQPEQFKAGDWVVDNETGEIAQANTVKYDPRYDGHFMHFTGRGYVNARHFRRATPAEIEDYRDKQAIKAAKAEGVYHPQAEVERELAQPDADGWIEHDGKGCPVAKGTSVDVRVKGGFVQSFTSQGKGQDWTNGDITHYRLAKLQPAPQTDWTITVTR